MAGGKSTVARFGDKGLNFDDFYSLVIRAVCMAGILVESVKFYA